MKYMRITNKVLSQGYLTDLNRNLQNMRKFQEQLASGKEIRRPSDDPFKVARSMELNTSLKANERYKENVDEALGWLETADSALGQFTDVLHRIKELTIAGGNATYSSTELDAVKKEMMQLKEQLVQIGNTVFDGRYIFNGDETTQIPFGNGGSISYPNTNGLKKEFAPGIVLDIGITSRNLCCDTIDPPGTDNVFVTVQNIINDLNSGISPVNHLDKLSQHLDDTLRLRGEVGAKTNRIETMSERTSEENFNMTELLSKTEDIDFAEKIMQYSVMESVYTASLQTGAKILQPSLLDFLR